MDGAIAGYLAFTTGAVGLLQRLGLLTIPLGLAVTAVINYLGGERAIKAVGVAILVMAILNIILASATGLGAWMGSMTSGGAAAATAVPSR